MRGRCILLVGTLGVGILSMPMLQASPQGSPQPPKATAPPAHPGDVNPSAQTMAEFTRRVEEYVALHKKVESALPALPKEATPKVIDTHQRAFAAGVAKARASAKPGTLFTPPMQGEVRRLMAQLFKDSAARRQLRDSVMDDNPTGRVTLAVNARYPDEVPLSTMPPDVLKNLPRLPKEVEYRFVGEDLILLDPDAHIVVDFMPRALPR
ncbi:MAG TPA: hypothetical protein VMF13_09590 [Luteitalea sp.]|nr:hypothetical protein [Luteitalea sp.]